MINQDMSFVSVKLQTISIA